MGCETDYLKETVGEALSRGIATVVSVQPEDPVEYLAHWLIKYVKKVETEALFYEDRKEQFMEQQAIQKSLDSEQEKEQQLEDDKRSELQKLSSMTNDPDEAWKFAWELVLKYTGAGSCYIANIVDPEEPEVELPEGEEDVESDVEADDQTNNAEGGEEEKQDEGGEPDSKEKPEEDLGPLFKLSSKPNYDNKFFRYVSASEGQEFLVNTFRELKRPPPPPEDADENYKSPPLPPTFKILDEQCPSLNIPNVQLVPEMTFHQEFPKFGSYYAAAAARPENGQYMCLVCADTVIPPGSGQKFASDDTDFVWDVSRSLGKALGGMRLPEKEAIDSYQKTKQDIEKLKEDIRSTRNPPKPQVEEGGENAEVEKPTEEEPAAEAAPEETTEDQQLDEIQVLQNQVTESKEKFEKLSQKFNLEQSVLNLISTQITKNKDRYFSCVKKAVHVLPQTYFILKAIYRLLQKSEDSFDNWDKCRKNFTLEIIDQLISKFDAKSEISGENWRPIRSAYKTVKKHIQLIVETPECGIGVIFLMFIRQSRKLSKHFKNMNIAQQEFEDLEKQLQQKQEEKANAVVEKQEGEEEGEKKEGEEQENQDAQE